MLLSNSAKVYESKQRMENYLSMPTAKPTLLRSALFHIIMYQYLIPGITIQRVEQ